MLMVIYIYNISYERDDYMSNLDERIEKAKEKYQKSVKNVERLQKKYDNLDFDKVTAMWPEDRKARVFEVEQESILYDIKSATDKMNDNKKILLNWMAKKSVDDKKNSVPVVPVIEKFLDDWVNKTRIYYNKNRNSYIDFINRTKDAIAKLYKDNNIEIHKIIRSREEEKKIETILKEAELDYKTINLHVSMLFSKFVVANSGKSDWDDIVERELMNERKYKRDMFYARVMDLAGNIIDASDLRIGKNGEINGIVIGDKNKVKVETISAGGYNIQCYHFRVLVKLI